MAKSQKQFEGLLEQAGIHLNGENPWDITVRDDRVFRRVLAEGALGLGESYMDGWWECEALDEFFYRILKTGLHSKVRGNWKFYWHFMKAKLLNLQRSNRAYQIGEHHYDRGNDLFEAMLDKRMNYSCAYWQNAENLDEAQEAKLELICRKLELEPGMEVLDLGCGFGSFAEYAAEEYGVEVTGVTVSKQQKQWFEGHRDPSLPVEIKLLDYREVEGAYDRVLSIGFFEHVGYKNYRTYMKTVDRCLKDDGISLLHTIGGNVSSVTTNQWTAKYIFPNGMLPSIMQIGKSMERLFVMEDWHNFGPDYDTTLLAWHRNFEEAWPELQQNYSERFHRMWRYYLLSSAGGFRARHTQLWQVVMTKVGRPQPESRVDIPESELTTNWEEVPAKNQR
ncbi:MAG: cyclopropane fatty acyl phospholipid synthase [Candidatus Marinimicrobia bacterium]|nr:cyclopropane fatty acyl phospholipid synthase [Candidatus Neomarinimicrobiota bacterium]MCF7829733.1 cyclopropane fatty acyl phospholipid synthase [Candidatus Neomarinimicrobiota bacterium]MCF7881683.1 cyclopropane fatty acyl phospholipid synthase [Candidatus Neomarinimicrobiota bacterium]